LGETSGFSWAKRQLRRPWLRILLVLLLLHVPWPGLGQLFGSYFSQVTPALLDVWSAPLLKLELSSSASSGADWSVLFDASDKSTGKRVQATIDIRRSAWLPLATFLALICGFSVSRPKRRALVAAGGLLVLHGMWLLPFLAFFGGPDPHFFLLGPTLHTAVVIAYRALISPPGMVYAVPAVLWFVLSWWLEPELM
jgi:hypothetical protein